MLYKILENGDGSAKPNASDTVLTHYEGRLDNGSVFDSSYDRGEPTTFPLSGVIAGWTEGLQLMNAGSKYQFKIPYELGYGEAGYPGVIPPKSTLYFEIELICF